MTGRTRRRRYRRATIEELLHLAQPGPSTKTYGATHPRITQAQIVAISEGLRAAVDRMAAEANRPRAVAGPVMPVTAANEADSGPRRSFADADLVPLGRPSLGLRALAAQLSWVNAPAVIASPRAARWHRALSVVVPMGAVGGTVAAIGQRLARLRWAPTSVEHKDWRLRSATRALKRLAKEKWPQGVDNG